MKLIRQKNDIDCGIACAAMVSGYHYKIAARADLTPWQDRGLSLAQMINIVRRLTRQKWSFSVQNLKKPLIDANLKPGILVVLIRDPEMPYGHWIVINKNIVYDPDFERPDFVIDYDRSNWLVITEIYL